MPTIEEQIYKRGLDREASRAEYVDAALELIIDITASAQFGDADYLTLLRSVEELADNARERI